MPEAAAPILATTREPADVHGVHGAAGLTHWKCLAARRHLSGEWEAVEWASLPPGAVSGEHRHTRTEEIYFLIRGEGELVVNGTPHPVGPGSLLLTGIGAVHGLRNTGATDLDWLVIEMPAPETTRVLRGRPAVPRSTPPKEGRHQMNARLYDLDEHGSVDPRELLTGPLSLVELIRVDPTVPHVLNSEGVEHTLFVLEGTGTAVSGDTSVPLAPGTALTLPLGGHAVVDTDSSLRCFHAVLDVAGKEAT
ncbi:cupin domain-containing protein [Nocardiopsis sp. FIRDI 009]|uniref:cupin domain-containing protein n=1 Tax=Nocardiopsis sp. FIRDI 009 TaxID=714197 RepID=UPI000E2454F6|nr:cupin domain-containing protein [Nocardiopsis sp. FIRDI 009]